MKNKLLAILTCACLTSSAYALEKHEINTWARCQLDICEEFIFELSMSSYCCDEQIGYWFGKMQAYYEIIALTREQIDWESSGECDCDDGDYDDVIY